jgi:hypothetical protein
MAAVLARFTWHNVGANVIKPGGKMAAANVHKYIKYHVALILAPIRPVQRDPRGTNVGAKTMQSRW